MKICVISFDHWNYDHYIVKELLKKGHESHHIKLASFKHKNSFARLKNAFSKVFFKKNLKHIQRQNFILEELEKFGTQDQILVINPELIDLEYHLKIKKHTSKYIAYLYDSVARCPVEHLLNGVFDEIYSFDKEDIRTYGFLETSNYIYHIEEIIDNNQKKFDYLYVGSIDERITFLNALGEKMKIDQKNFLFLSIGKKSFMKKLRQFFLNENRNITFSAKRLSHDQMLELYKQSNFVLDVVRENQTGLSFRIFECMGINANVISTNKNLENYDLIHSGKIFIYDPNLINYNSVEKYPLEMIKKYSIETWVENVFKLKI